MKELDYVYFTIYHHYSQRSYFPDSQAVRLKSMYLLSLSAGGWILFLQTLILRFVKNAWFTSQGDAMIFALSVYTVITLLFHRIFIVNEHDQKIFNKYANAWNTNPNKRRDLFIALFVAAIPYIAMVVLKVVVAQRS
ncbi:MAG: hypothetical protein H7Y31_11825 [Chitinophagaceae bacterium]|nr:hypothetical protein [Chitinophagaceae bacterium]